MTPAPRLSAATVAEILSAAEASLRASGQGDVLARLEQFLAEQEAVLHPGNHLVVTAKMRLGWMYGNWPQEGLQGGQLYHGSF